MSETHRPMIVSGVKPEASIAIRHNRSYVRVGSRKFGLHVHEESLHTVVKQEIVIAFLRMRPGLLWMHAGVVALDDRALLIVAPSAGGKSTLVIELLRRGWHYLSDEAAPIQPGSSMVHPWPRAPARRENSGHLLRSADVGELPVETEPVPSDIVRTRAVRVAGVLFPAFALADEPLFEPVSAGNGAMRMLGNVFNFGEHRNNALVALSRIATAVPMYSVRYSSGQTAARDADAIYRSEWK